MENNKIIPSEIAEVPHHNTHLHTVASNALCTRMYVFNWSDRYEEEKFRKHTSRLSRQY